MSPRAKSALRAAAGAAPVQHAAASPEHYIPSGRNAWEMTSTALVIAAAVAGIRLIASGAEGLKEG